MAEIYLNTPENFEFPFKPYDIQLNFMKTLYNVIENKNLGIFESPTGTGKSLSIICAALRWLKDHNERETKSIERQIETIQKEIKILLEDNSDWLTSKAKEIEFTHKLNSLKIENERILLYNKSISELISKKRPKLEVKVKQKLLLEEEDTAGNLVVDDDDDDLIEDVPQFSENDSDEEDDSNKYVPIKIYICSRTHSQLSQLIGEIKKSEHGQQFRTISLGSRQNFCINDEVLKLRNIHLINERCLDMQRNKSKSTKKEDGKVIKRQRGENCKCPFYKQSLIEDLRTEAIAEVKDIEDLVSNGKELKACPYYASRLAAKDAQLILVPYNTLFHKPTREANGLSLKNNVVVIDEAHNVLDALAQMYSSEVRYEQLYFAHQQLTNYKKKYSTRFSAYNLLCINQLLFIILKLKEFLEKQECKDGVENPTKIFQVQNFVIAAEIDNYNLFKLIKFARITKLSQKLHSFTTKFDSIDLYSQMQPKGVKNFLNSIKEKEIKFETTSENKKIPTNCILSVTSFLESLTYAYEDGRILLHHPSDTNLRKFQFLLLNPASQIKDLINETRALIVAGGTMKPTSEFKHRLFKSAGADVTRIVEFSCNHIIPPENILPIIVTKGTGNESLVFNYENRFKMGKNVLDIIVKTCKTVVGGIVVFFPSYKYETWVWSQAKEINFGRPVFREPQDSASVDKVLSQYASAVAKRKNSGALLFSVVGGKLSEGLNFSDELGRCVIVVGMPYPNIYAPDLKEKMAYIEKLEGFGSGQKFYESLCMKAVNQCIGRAVRHQNDYATVLLLDERYNRQFTKNSLPQWIQRSLRTCNYEQSLTLLAKFFDKMKKK